MLKNKKYNWQNTNYINLISSFAMDFAAYFFTFFETTLSLSLLLIDNVGLFFLFIMNRAFSSLKFKVKSIIMVNPCVNKFFDSPSYTEKIIPNNSIQKSVEFFVACRVKSSLILLYIILYFINISINTFFQFQRNINMMFALLFNISGYDDGNIKRGKYNA